MIEGKNAIVTGVSKEIGRETAKLLPEEGVNAIGWSRNQPVPEHNNFIFVKADVADFEIHPNYHPTVPEIRPLRPKGKQ